MVSLNTQNVEERLRRCLRKEGFQLALEIARVGKFQEVQSILVSVRWQIVISLDEFELYLLSSEGSGRIHTFLWNKIKSEFLWRGSHEESDAILKVLLRRGDFRNWLVLKEI